MVFQSVARQELNRGEPVSLWVRWKGLGVWNRWQEAHAIARSNTEPAYHIRPSMRIIQPTLPRPRPNMPGRSIRPSEGVGIPVV